MPKLFIFGAVAVFERHPFCHRYLLYRSGSVSTFNFLHCFYILYFIKHSLFIVYLFLYVLKELRHLINDIKLDTVLTINNSWTKTGRAVARGKI